MTLATAISALLLAAAPAPADEAAELIAAFEAHTGVHLVFERKGLPVPTRREGAWYSILKPIEGARKVEALGLLTREMKVYPRGYLAAIGLKTFGLFAGCGGRVNDGFHAWSEELGGYAYLGMWDHRDAAIAAYYDQDGLVRTFHHEIFHHVDATRAGKTDDRRYFAESKARLAAALSGKQPFAALQIAPEDLAALEAIAGKSAPLLDRVSQYSTKDPIEDRAENARFLMMHLPVALLQMAREPQLAGSQRLLFTLAAYRAAHESAPDAKWLVDRALGRAR